MDRKPSISAKMPRWSVLPFAPICVVATFIILANVVFIIFRLRLPYPVTPWEAGIVTDAWRMLQGDTIYAAGTDHATHMYGPLITVVLAQAFKFVGPVLEVGRIVSAISGTAIVILLASLFGRGDRLTFAIAVALLLAANTRTGYYFTETRPDMVSLFFACVALIVFYHGQESAKKQMSQIALMAAGSALLVIAVMFKQTAAVFMFVPALVMMTQFGRFSFQKVQLLLAAIPIACVVTVLVGVWYLTPGLWHFIAEVPAQYKISVLRMGRMGVELLVSFPLFVFAIMHWAFADAQIAPRTRWLMAAMTCAIPMSLAACAKDGGNANCLIPAILSISVVCAWRTPVALALLRDQYRSLRLRTATGALLGILLFAHAYPVPQFSLEALKGGNGTADRTSVVAEARLLPGKVISPDDPTIALMAKGYAGRTAVFEADAVYWDINRSQAFVREIDSADYVIALRQAHIWPDWGTTDEVLQARGFAKVAFQTTSPSVYELWQRMPLPNR
jgi:4-amino-4-deoxy-L-arabinose transferase-like glycosyltransferase